MDEFEPGGWDPRMTQYFRKIVASFSYGTLWMVLMSTLGLYYKLGIVYGRFKWYNVVFYVIFLLTFFLLLRFLYRTWGGRLEGK